MNRIAQGTLLVDRSRRAKVAHGRVWKRFGSLSGALVVFALISGCALGGTSSPTSPSCAAEGVPASANFPGSADSGRGSLVLVGRIVTMDEPPIAEALLIEDGQVTCVGSRDDVLALADEQMPVVDIGSNVAYPGFIDAHAHWIHSRSLSGIDSAEEAMDAALRRGWTSISEQMVLRDGLDELRALANEDGLPLRVDAYLFLGAVLDDWYVDHQRGPVGDRLRIQGLKIGLDEDSNLEQGDLTQTIGRADAAGWQVSVHSVTTGVQEMALDAFEAALGPSGPNALHHRVEHAIEVSDDQLDRMVAMDLATVIHLDAAAADWALDGDDLGYFGPEPNTRDEVARLARWRDFVDAGLHVAAATDSPWISPGFELTEDIGRPVDQIAGGMDGRGRVNPETPEWVLDQLLTAEQGLRAVTLDAAYALGDEARRGHLAPGTLGDVTILSGDVTDATPGEIRAFDVIATIVGGTVAYCSDPAVCGGD
jgi:predicted amidohydrolase YtcJ